MLGVLERIRSLAGKKTKDTGLPKYRQLVAAVADGKDVANGAVEILESAGRSVEDLEADVRRLLRRRELVELVAAGTKMEAEIARLVKDDAGEPIDAEFRAAIDRFHSAPKIDGGAAKARQELENAREAYLRRRHARAAVLSAAAAARLELIETADEELLLRSEAINDEMRSLKLEERERRWRDADDELAAVKAAHPEESFPQMTAAVASKLKAFTDARAEYDRLSAERDEVTRLKLIA